MKEIPDWQLWEAKERAAYIDDTITAYDSDEAMLVAGRWIEEEGL